MREYSRLTKIVKDNRQWMAVVVPICHNLQPRIGQSMWWMEGGWYNPSRILLLLSRKPPPRAHGKPEQL